MTGISTGSIHTILHEHLGMSKVSARWVPRMLTPEEKKFRVDCSELNILLKSQHKDFFSPIVTGDETRVHFYGPEIKLDSMQYKHKGSPPPKKLKV